MKIIRTKDYADMSRKAANIISAQVIMKPDCVLGLATGGTPVGTYEKLVERYNEGDLDFSEVTSVNLDEYRGLPKEHPESYWSFMHRNLFDHVNIDPAHINLPDGTNMDAEAECKRYDEVIRSVGGVDLQLLGIGHDGHIGFNEPHDAFDLVLRCAFGIYLRLNAHAFAIDRQTQGRQNSQQQHGYGNHRQIQLAEKEQQYQNNTKRHPIDDPAFFSGHQRCAPAAGLISVSSLFSRSRAPIPSTRACGRSTIRCAHTSANIS